MKYFILITLSLLVYSGVFSQKFMTRSGYIGFYSHTPLEDIKADNNQVSSILDTETGEIVFQALMRSFSFEKKLMEEHFNENYVESESFPKASFEGNIKNHSDIPFDEDGIYEVIAEGKLTMHGVTQEISVPGKITVADGKIAANSNFTLKPEDFDIEIPSVVRNKIAKEIEIRVEMNYNKM